MKALSVFLFLFSFGWIGLMGQNQHFIKNHESGALTWSDFKGTPPKKASSTQAIFYLGYRPATQRAQDSTVYRLLAVGYFDQGLSYADSAQRSGKRLRYHQIQFDLLEVHRRQLQKELDMTTQKTDLDALFRNLNATYISLKTAFEREAEIEVKEPVLLKWEEKLDSLLLAIPRFVKPASTVSPFNFGAFYGIGYSFFDAQVEGRVKSGFYVPLGLQVGYKRAFFQLSIRRVPLNLQNGFEELGVRYSSIYSDFYHDFLLGYKVLEKARITVAPVVGIARLFNEGIYSLGRDEVRFLGGLTIDVVLNRRYDNYKAAFGKRKVYAVQAIRTQLLVSNYSFPNGTNSLLFSCGLGISIGGGMIR